jgi:hypothetical protein
VSQARTSTLEVVHESFPLSDNGNAEYFEREMDHRIAYDHTSRQWYEFNGHHWRVDAVQHVVERAVEAMRSGHVMRRSSSIPSGGNTRWPLRSRVKSTERSAIS